jgi:hypothetical protein
MVINFEKETNHIRSNENQPQEKGLQPTSGTS